MDIRPTLTGLPDAQRQLVTAWCALYVVRQMQGCSIACAYYDKVLGALRGDMTSEAAHRCALWEKRYWRERNKEEKNG